MSKTCSVDGCSKPIKACSLCSMHYSRKLKTGKTEANKRSRTGEAKLFPNEHRSWECAKRRCTQKSHDKYQYYGGRGIKMCDRWLGPEGFIKFLEDMGPKPSPRYSLDRIDPNGDYCPENCRWADRWTQARNRRRNSNTGVVGVHHLSRDGIFVAYAMKNGIPLQRKFHNFNDAVAYRESLELSVLKDDDDFVS